MKLKNYLNKNDGYAFVVLILIVLGLGTLGITLATSSVANFINQKNFRTTEQNYYDADGAMTHVQTILEQAAAYARQSANEAAKDAYEAGLALGEPMTNAELKSIVEDEFKRYLTVGKGKTYIDAQLQAMETDPVFLSFATPAWNNASFSAQGLTLAVTTQNQQKNQKIRASFLLPLHYYQEEEQEIVIGGGSTGGKEPVFSLGMPIGFYNPLFRAGITLNGTYFTNGGAHVIVNALAKRTSGIALQFTQRSGTLMEMNAPINVQGTTLPQLEIYGSRTLISNSREIYVNGERVAATEACEDSARIKLSDYYDASYMSQITPNSSFGHFTLTEGDLFIRIYTGSAILETWQQLNDWKSLSGKRGLIIINGIIKTNGGGNLQNFSGGMVLLGTGQSFMNSLVQITHDEEAILDAIELFERKTGKDTLRKMFKLDTLMTATTDPASVTKNVISGSSLLRAPLIIGNQTLSNGRVVTNGTSPYFYFNGKTLYLNNTITGMLASSSPITPILLNGGTRIYINRVEHWNLNDHNKPQTVPVIGNVFDKLDPTVLQRYMGEPSVSRDTDVVLKIYPGNVTVRNAGNINDELITRKKGLIFVNGRLEIDGVFEFTGVVIATNGIHAYNGGAVVLTYDPEAALKAINSAYNPAALFNDGTNMTTYITSVYGSGSGGGSNNTVIAAPNAGQIRVVKKGVDILEWNKIK